MKKILLGCFLFFLVVLGGFFVTGLITESTLKKNLVALNEANDFSVDLAHYKRGLFQSTADLKWHVTVSEKITKKENENTLVIPPKAYTFDMPLAIYHGPVMFENGHFRFGLGSAQGNLSLPKAYISDFLDTFASESTQPTLSMKLFVSYLCKTHLELALPPFQLLTKQNHSQFEWLGMSSDVHFSPESTRLKGHFLLDGLRITGDKFRILLNKVSSAYEAHKAKNGLFLGDAKLDVPILQVSVKKQPEFYLKQLEVSSNNTLENDLFASSFHLAFKTLLSGNETYGPAEFDVGIKKLDANVLAELNQHLNQLHRADTTGGQTQQLLLSLLPQLPKLLGKGAVFEVSAFKLGMPDGTADGSLRIAFPLSKGDGPIQIIPKVIGEGRLQMPASFVKTLLVHSFKQQTIQAHEDALADKSDKKSYNNKKILAASTLNAKPDVADKTDSAASLTLAALDQQAVQHADQKLADLIRMGVFQPKGGDYVLELKLSSGRLLVNGHPFNTGMLSL
ncbi:MAG: YdgA family protein [Gammaproteobacteria bacterium]|nr:YdgA family protein [Gammaproteobacteria bacterium]